MMEKDILTTTEHAVEQTPAEQTPAEQTPAEHAVEQAPAEQPGKAAATATSAAPALRASLAGLFAQKNLVILDGAMATELERQGLDLNDALWSARVLVEHPEAIRAVHYDYFVNGADCGTAASYQATLPGFAAKGYSEAESRALITRSMELLLDARAEWWENEGKASGRALPLAAAAIGPYGAFLSDGSEYTGRYHLSEEEYREFHRPRMEILKEAGAEIFAVETLPRLDEALACAGLMDELDSDYWLSFTFQNDHQITDGHTIEEVVAALGIGRPAAAAETADPAEQSVEPPAHRATTQATGSAEQPAHGAAAAEQSAEQLAHGAAAAEQSAEQLAHGATAAEQSAKHPRLLAIGVNCTQPAHVEGIVRNFRACTDLPVCVYPNRGETFDPVTKTWHGVANSKIYGALAKTWYRAGARLIGGCCRTRPEDIRQIAKWYAEEQK